MGRENYFTDKLNSQIKNCFEDVKLFFISPEFSSWICIGKLSISALCLILLWQVYNEQRSTNLYNLHSMECRFLSWDGQWAGQQQLSGDHRLQEEGQRRGWLEDIVRIHTCVVHKNIHMEGIKVHSQGLIHSQHYSLSFSLSHTQTHTLIWTWASSCGPLCQLHLQQQEQVTTLK